LRYELQEINIKVEALQKECQALRKNNGGSEGMDDDQQKMHKEVIESY
jgi:hypothetical protein